MSYSLKFAMLALVTLLACDSLAASAVGRVIAGTRVIAGKITEWPVPTAKYPRDPAVAPDGRIYFAVRKGDKLARFDPRTRHFQEWNLPVGAAPNGVAAAADGKVYFGSHDRGIIGELDPATGKLVEFRTPSNDSKPYTLTLDTQGNVWFTERNTGKVGKLDRSSGKVTEYPVGDDPYGIAVDKMGNVWLTRKRADMFAKLDPNTGKVTEIHMGLGAQPRRIAVAPNGMLWVSLYGKGAIANINPDTLKVIKTYRSPGGSNAGPYAVNADAGGRIWVSEIQTDNIVMLDPRTDAMQVFKLPSKDTGVRNAAIDAQGRYWYVGSYNGMVGVIE